MECEISRCLSQNWSARVSGILFNADVEGDDQSVGRTGSQTTKTRSGLPANSRRMRSAAEAPCRHIAQVGDNSSNNRTSFFAALNSFLTSPTFSAVRLLSGDWPGGACPPPE